MVCNCARPAHMACNDKPRNNTHRCMYAMTLGYGLRSICRQVQHSMIEGRSSCTCSIMQMNILARSLWEAGVLVVLQ
jgi:hypothetical protein